MNIALVLLCVLATAVANVISDHDDSSEPHTPVPTALPGQYEYYGIALVTVAPSAFNATTFLAAVAAATPLTSDRASLAVITYCAAHSPDVLQPAASYMATAGCLGTGANVVADTTYTAVVFTVLRATEPGNLTAIDAAGAGFAESPKPGEYYYTVTVARFGDVPSPDSSDGGGGGVNPIGIIITVVILVALAAGVFFAVRCLKKRRAEEDLATRQAAARAMAGIGPETYGLDVAASPATASASAGRLSPRGRGHPQYAPSAAELGGGGGSGGGGGTAPAAGDLLDSVAPVTQQRAEPPSLFDQPPIPFAGSKQPQPM